MNFKRNVFNFATVAVFAFAGGFAAQVFFAPIAARAQMDAESFFGLHDAKNSKGINFYVADGQPGGVFYGEDGGMRLQMGTYPGAGERGQPLVGLSDAKGHLRLLLRLAGTNNSPVLVMKDDAGRDRVVLGLALEKAEQEPFLTVTGNDGKAREVFGEYQPH